MSVNYTDFDKIWASTSPLTPYEFSESQYKEGWNFVGATPPARQMWDSYMKWSDEKQQYIVNNFLPLSGGAMTGTIKVSNGTSVMGASNTGYVGIYNNSGGGGYLAYGTNHSTRPGFLHMTAKDSSQSKTLEARPDGTLTWDGKDIITSDYVQTFNGNNTYNVNGYKIGRLCVVTMNFENFASGWHTTETILTSNFPLFRTPIIVGAVSSGSDTNVNVRLSVEPNGKLYGYATGAISGGIYCACVYISAS